MPSTTSVRRTLLVALARLRRRSRGPVEQRRWWPWAVGILVPAVLVYAGARLAFQQAPEQEVRSQRAVQDQTDAEMAERPALLAAVRAYPATQGPLWQWAFERELSAGELDRFGAVARSWLAAQAARDRAAVDAAIATMRQAGGTPIQWFPGEGRSRHLVTLTSNRRERLRIADMRVTVLSGRQMRWRTLLRMGGQSIEENQVVIADPDDPAGPIRTVEPDSTWGPEFLAAKTVNLETGEPVTLDLSAFSRSCRCTWELTVTAAHGAQQEKVTVRADGTATGAPFETVGWGIDRTIDEYDFSVQSERYEPGTREGIPCPTPGTPHARSWNDCGK